MRCNPSWLGPPSASFSRLLFCAFLMVGCGTEAPPMRIEGETATLSEVVDPRIDAFLQGAVAEEHFSGAALVVKDGAIMHAKGYGLAAPGKPNTVNTVFHVASVTKQFTAAAVLQLVEAGMVDLDGSINAYLPQQYWSPVWQGVRVRHLLSHSSGITDYAVVRDYYDVVDGFCLGDTVNGMIREAMEKPLEFAPGTQYTYSNIGFTLLGEIIEEQTGMPYAQYMQEKILRPMGMTSSRIHVEGHVPSANEAAGYRWDEATQQHVKDDVVSLPVTAPDGGLVTTLGDFMRWIQLYAGGDQEILTQASLDAMTSPQISLGRDGEIDSYGFGLSVGERLLGHSGYIVGFR
ncbi:MAG: serine hydrolase domain-containing protein, partial [Pseudomonadota bacterium]